VRRELRQRLQEAVNGDPELAKDQKTLRRTFSKISKREIADFKKVDRGHTRLALMLSRFDSVHVVCVCVRVCVCVCALISSSAALCAIR
jgi:hypothetical protein